MGLLREGLIHPFNKSRCHFEYSIYDVLRGKIPLLLFVEAIISSVLVRLVSCDKSHSSCGCCRIYPHTNYTKERHKCDHFETNKKVIFSVLSQVILIFFVIFFYFHKVLGKILTFLGVFF